jgi:cytoskeletal protein RodZ
MQEFGEKLRQARERRGISLRQISAKTKISVAALEALERNDISKLPGGIFSRAFVRSYAIEVGLAPDATVDEFIERFNQETPPTAASVAASVPDIERVFEDRRRRATRALIIAAIAVPVIVGVVVYLYFRGRAA